MPTDQPPSLAVQDATLSLLLRVNRLLAEADAVRELRDRLIDTARGSTAPHTRPGDPAEAVRA